jgi:23S rRNA pseudouridine2605 synthase
MTKKKSKTKDLIPESTEPKVEATPENKIEDPIGDETDGEAGTASEAAVEAGIEAAENEAETEVEAEDSPEPEADSEFTPMPGAPTDGSSSVGWKPRPPAKLERLQKILAQAGVASRRKAEEMIEQGRVQVNGKVVTVLGTKADAARDHIRVDGKLLQGPERLRYFVLNKPRGFVTTVRDPEGRPTVMQFFDKMRERLYPVGRLDYMSEGLLLVTNDGELANRLTKAASGVEKTYLVKVAGQPSESELDILRGGVAIERGKPGSPQVRTSPARIRQVRQGDNPWYEVVLIEGRNRELRKMFEEIGHFVEKIRRVGYGPLVLDQEPGNMRELAPAELDALRKTAEGKLRTPKSKEVRRRNALDAAGLPTVAPRPTIHPRPAKPFAAKPFQERSSATGDSRPRKFFAQDKTKPFRPVVDRSAERGGDRPLRTGTAGPARFSSARPAVRPSGRPAWQKDDRSTRRPARFTEGPTSEGRPVAPRLKTPVRDEDFGPVKPSNLRIEEIQQPEPSNFARPSAPRSSSSRPNSGRPFRGEGGLPRAFTTSSGKPRVGGARPSSKPGAPTDRSSSVGWKAGVPTDRSSSVGWKPGKPAGRSYGSGPSARPASGPRTGATRAGSGSGYRPSSGGKRSFDGPSSGSGSRPARSYTPRPEGASGSRFPNTKKFAGSSSFRGTGPRSESPRREGPGGERKTGAGWKPKTRYGGPNKPASGVRSKPRPGSSAKSAYKGKPSGKRPGGAPGGKKHT